MDMCLFLPSWKVVGTTGLCQVLWARWDPKLAPEFVKEKKKKKWNTPPPPNPNPRFPYFLKELFYGFISCILIAQIFLDLAH